VTVKEPRRIAKAYRQQKLDRVRAKAAARTAELQEFAHPLDPLSPDELEIGVATVQRHPNFRYGMRFGMVMLKEPPKADLNREAVPPRMAEIILIDNASQGSFRVNVDVVASMVTTWTPVDGQPAIAPDEFAETEIVVKNDGRVLEALRRRGLDLEDRSQVNVDPWSAGYFGAPEEGERRIARGLIYVKHGLEDNQYAHVVDGVSAIVDLNEQEVLEVEDVAVLPVPKECDNWAASYQRRFREDIKPLEITQPEGPSFTVQGNLVTWQKWSMRVGFSPREGLVLHQVSYDDDGDVRPLFNRISVAEMTVPYADVAFLQYRKNAFDIGEYGIGVLSNSLERGCDCLGEIYYFDYTYVNAFGDLMPIPNAICMHEEDNGILWKHYDFRTDRTEVRRSRRLVLSFVATVGNYEYAFYWHFYQDASIELEVKATGVVQTGALPDGETSPFGTMILPNLYASNHQHHFCVRMDCAIDGDLNQVTEVDTKADPIGPTNPYGNAFYARRTTFQTESEAIRDIDVARSRYWLIQSSERTNRMGYPTGYKIEPGETAPPYAQEGSSLHQRAGYIWHNLWVTPYHEDERYPGGEFPNQHPGGDGLPRWVEQDRPIQGKDIVVWYSFGHHHIVRAEDWPVMPVAKVGFRLKPVNFFNRNPAIDVPPSPAKHNADDYKPHCC